MRKIMRNIARARMKKLGITKVNKKRYVVKNGMLVQCPSYFAENWRKFL